jgi:senataxin
LSELISSSISTSHGAPHLETGSYGQIEPDDFWRNVRDWDFLTNYVKSQTPTTSSKKGGSAAANNNAHDEDDDGDDDVKILRQKKPLPDRFVNHRHYIASWAPLCLAEMRAQLLQEVATNWNNKFIPVTIEVNQKNVGTTLDSVVVVIKPKVRSNDHSLHANDACLLVPEKYAHAVQQLFAASNTNNSAKKVLSPPDKSWRNCALLGHTEFPRKSLDGLQLKVSKKWWAKIHQSDSDDWRLLKVGCNITALREFTALCADGYDPTQEISIGSASRRIDDSCQGRY